MKITITILIVLCSLSPLHSQGMPVYDNTSFLTLAKSLIESAKQTSQLLKTVKFLKEQKDRIEQVNNIIKELKAVQEITRNNQQLYEVVRDDIREIVESPYIHADEVDQISNSFDILFDNALEDLDFMRQVLTSGYLEMTDAERLEILKAQQERSREMLAEVELKKKRYKGIIEFRRLRQAINNRETSH